MNDHPTTLQLQQLFIKLTQYWSEPYESDEPDTPQPLPQALHAELKLRPNAHPLLEANRKLLLPLPNVPLTATLELLHPKEQDFKPALFESQIHHHLLALPNTSNIDLDLLFTGSPLDERRYREISFQHFNFQNLGIQSIEDFNRAGIEFR